MLTSYTIVICLNSLAAPPSTLPLPPAHAESAYTVDASEGVSDVEGANCQECGHHGRYKGPVGDWLCPRCDMSQRFPYYPTNHGHYYFRPYHMQRVREQQGQAISWGEDARNPYGQLVFDRVYEQLRREQAQDAETLPPQKAEPMIEVQPKAPAPEKADGILPPDPPPAEPKEGRQSSKRPFRFSR